MPDDQHDKLQQLHTSVINELLTLTDHMADDDDVSYQLLINLARTTDNPTLLYKAFEKVKKMEDPKNKTDALLEVLDEIEVQLNLSAQPPDGASQADPAKEEVSTN